MSEYETIKRCIPHYDGTLEKKCEIYAALGRNFLIKDKKVSIQWCEWFVPIKNAYPKLEAQYNRLELTGNGSINEKTPAFAEVISRWGGQRGSNSH